LLGVQVVSEQRLPVGSEDPFGAEGADSLGEKILADVAVSRVPVEAVGASGVDERRGSTPTRTRNRWERR
jgi:hypothetical protein